MGHEGMLSVDHARSLLLRAVKDFGSFHSPLEVGNGHVLAEELRTPIDMPPFSRSAMDGYALRGQDLGHYERFRTVGSADAGASELPRVGEGEACRIHTGAMIPEGADRVVKQEDVEVDPDGSILLKTPPKQGANIRPQGEELKEEDLALEAGTLLRPASIAFLASLGIPSVSVLRKPRVAILSTGDELHRPGEGLSKGGIYESNSYGIAAALEKEGFEVGHRVQVPDRPEKLREELEKALQNDDVLILSGGISVGDRDHVKEALLSNGIEQVFHKVSQKPGKPLFFGGGEGSFAFGLPGNPAASLVGLYEYVLPFLRACSGENEPFPTRVRLPLLEGWPGRSDRTVFLKAKLEGEGVRPLEGQSSAMLRTFALADALVRLEPGEGGLEKGDPVEVHLLPH